MKDIKRLYCEVPVREMDHGDHTVVALLSDGALRYSFCGVGTTEKSGRNLVPASQVQKNMEEGLYDKKMRQFILGC